MKNVKTKKTDLEKRRFAFFAMGLMLVGATTLTAFEWTTVNYEDYVTKLEPEKEAKIILVEQEPVIIEDKTEQVVENRVVQETLPDDREDQDQNDQMDIDASDETREAEDDETVNKGSLILDPNLAGLVEKKKKPVKMDFTWTDELQVEPEFLYGNVDDWLYEKVNYPRSELKMNREGRVSVQFVVDNAGKVTKVKIVGSTSEAFANEVLKVIEQMPDWKPGEMFGHKVNVTFIQTVHFKLN